MTLTSGMSGRLWLTISVPRPVAQRLGVRTRVRLSQPVTFHFCGEELSQRIVERRSTRLDLAFGVTKRGKPAVTLRASWQRPPAAEVVLRDARQRGVVGVDFNADHFACWYLDPAGNPVGAPRRIPLILTGLSTATRDARLREALSRIIEYAARAGASAIAVEDLGFAELETSREAYGRNRAFRDLLTRFPTAQFRDRLPRMARSRNLAIIAVDPAYTSRVGGASWEQALFDDSVIVTRHEGAAVAIGRRALAHGLTARTRGRPRAPAAAVRLPPARWKHDRPARSETGTHFRGWAMCGTR
jgi:hypothetical protein